MIDPVDEPLRKNGAWVLPYDTFDRWWQLLSPTNRAEFELRGGDAVHARFVCAFILLSDKLEASANLVVLAWSMATEKPLDANAMHAQAERALERDCVRTLIDRIWRERRNFATKRLAQRSAKLLESMIDNALRDDSISMQAKAVAASAQYLRYETLENERVEDEQRRLGADKAAAQLANSGQTLEELSIDQLQSFAKAIGQAIERKKQKAVS